MRRTALLLTACTMLLLCVSASRAAFVTGCCACIPAPGGTVSQVGAPTEALFCSNVMGEAYPAFVSACTDAEGGPVCTDEVQGESCQATLLQAESILCPKGPGAPTANALGLLGLAAALSAAGAWHLRRRRV